MAAITELHGLLQRQLGLCRRLLMILKLTRQTLSKADPKPLEDCVAQQLAIATELAEVDGARQTVIDQLAQAHGLTEGGTLSDLLSALPADQSAHLAQVATDLANLVGDIQKLQDVNEVLLKHALEYVDFNMELIADLQRQTSAPATYNPYGQAAAYSDAPPARSAVNLNA
jgi:flagellar biosynthesis/type III secretory pathway chaperone